MNDDDSLPPVPLFRLLTADQVAALLKPANSFSAKSILHDAPTLVQWAKEHHLMTAQQQRKTRTVNHNQPPSPPKRRMRHNPEHEHL